MSPVAAFVMVPDRDPCEVIGWPLTQKGTVATELFVVISMRLIPSLGVICTPPGRARRIVWITFEVKGLINRVSGGCVLKSVFT